MENEFNKEVGQRLYKARKAKGYSRAKVGELVGLHETTVKRYEDGEIKSLDVERLKAFAQVLGTSAAELVGWVADSDEDLALMMELSMEARSGRPAAEQQMRRLFGSKHSMLSTYLCHDDSSKVSLLYYKAMSSEAAAAISGTIEAMEQIDPDEAVKVMLLVQAYLKAEQPIQNIVNTALEPYVEKETLAWYKDAQIV